MFPPADAGSSAARTDPDWSHIHAEMKRRGMTLALLWQEYRAEHAQGYAYSWFCERYSDGGEYIDNLLDGFVGAVVCGFELAIWTVVMIRAVVEAAVGDRSAEPFMEEQK